MNAWILLGVAIVLEVFGTTCLKLSHGFTRPWPVAGVVVFYLAAFGFLSLCLKSLEVGVAYAMWSGLGTALIAVLGILIFGEGMSWTKALGLVLIISGAVLLNLTSKGGAH
jgi:multidrug transporter EmrE-like cation transporter